MLADNHSSLAHVRDVAATAREPYVLDAIDLALLKILVADCRTSQRQIATMLGVSAPTVGERMARLERNGVITGYSAQVDWSVVGYGQVVFLSIEAGPGYDVAAIMAALDGPCPATTSRRSLTSVQTCMVPERLRRTDIAPVPRCTATGRRSSTATTVQNAIRASMPSVARQTYRRSSAHFCGRIRWT